MDIDIQGIILNILLKNSEESLNIWTKLKPSYFSSVYSSLYSKISKHYDKFGKLPTFSDLELHIRDKNLKINLLSLKRLDLPEDLDLDLAVEALIDEYTQDITLDKISSILDTITLKSSEEIKEDINELALFVEEKTHTSEEIFLMSDLELIDEHELATRVKLGLQGEFDHNTGGIPLTELIMLGGLRGSGKSIVSENIAVNQYLSGDIGLIFSIEMRAREVFSRCISILSEVDYTNIKTGNIAIDEFNKIAKIRADMFEDSDDVYDEYLNTLNYTSFEKRLLREKTLKQDNQIIIVDNQVLTLSDIDLNIQKFKTKFGDKLKVVIVDYVNQIAIDNMYDWITQIKLSKKLKDLARKYEIVMFTPYQINDTGEARFSKGLLDAADLAMILKPEKDYIDFKSTKTRGMAPFNFQSYIDWKSLKIKPYITKELLKKDSDDIDGNSTITH